MAEIQYIVLTIEKGTRKSFPNLISLATACGGFRSIPPYFAPLMLVKYAKSKSQFSTKVFEKKTGEISSENFGKTRPLEQIFLLSTGTQNIQHFNCLGWKKLYALWCEIKFYFLSRSGQSKYLRWLIAFNCYFEYLNTWSKNNPEIL